jgi:lambda family phage portal protein
MNEVVTEQPKVTWLSAAGDFIDRCIYAVAPVYGAQRLAFRRSISHLGAFEGGTHDTTRGSSWIGSRLSTDSSLEEDLPSLRGRSRELYRNDSFGGTIDDKVNHVVGTGFTPQSRIDPRIVGTEAADVFNAENELIYKRWAPQCDISGRTSLWQQTCLMARHLEFDGEAIAVFSFDPDPTRPIPLVLEVIDPERLETPPSMIGNKLCRMGVEKDADGRILAYWIRKTHPGDTLDISEQFDRVEAWRVLHLYEQWFAGQTRGLPWLCRTVNRLKDCKDLDEAMVITQQVQACFAVFVKTQYNPQSAAQAASTSTSGTNRLQEIRPGGIHYQGIGEEVQFASPPTTNSFAQAQELNYRRIAAAVNWPYEMLLKNWAGLSFAAGRLVLTGLRLNVKSRQKLIDEKFLCPVWKQVIDTAVAFGALLQVSSIEPRLYQRRPWVYTEHKWTPPAWSYALTPGEEIKANVDAVNNNQKTLAAVVAESGEDLEEVLDQREREMKMQRDKDILPPELAAAEMPDEPVQAAERKVTNAS